MAKAKAKKKTVTRAATKAPAKTVAPKRAAGGDAHADAIRLIEAGDWNGGLAALGAVWTKSRNAQLAAEIERLGAHAAKSRAALDASSLQASWENACATGSLVGLEHLLAVIRDGTADDIRARFDRLRERAPDPRMTAVVKLFASELHLRSDQARAVWTAFFKLVTHTGDPRAAKPLENLAALAKKVRPKEKFEDYLLEQVPKVIDKLPAATAYDGIAALRTAVDALVKKPVNEVARTTDVDALYAQILETPGDTEQRRVWADALLEANDDRGTFVMLQLESERRALTGAEDKQMSALLAANRLRWLGQAGAVLDAKTATFRHGLLDSAEFDRKAKLAQLDARELRTATQLYARTPDLLGHPNLVSLQRLGRECVPNVASTTGPFGFDYFGPGGSFDHDETLELAKLVRTRITHLETGLPQDLNVDAIQHAFPDLDTVLVEYSWSDKRVEMYEPMIPWLAGMRDVVFKNIMDSREANDGWFVDRLPRSNVHFVYGGGELYRSYLRRDGGLHAVFTDTSTKGGFSDGGKRDQQWIGWRTKFFANVPAIDSLVFRQRSTWPQIDVDAVAANTKNMKNVTLPRAKKS
jgi:uncharacterized protein (TIGR02996 family)